tara:strand:- start:327 stop:1259 length:933 start_codon:yes stop_codon:yes gene_type:complete
MKILKPKFWDQNYFTFLSILLFPISLLYRFILFLRKLFVAEKKFAIPIICVGNIYIGGTGKTPISLKICKILKEFNQNPVIIKKNYKNHIDEISLIKKHNKVLTSEKRGDAIIQAIEKKFNFAVLDDGYQDLSIKKNLNIVCFHGKQKLGNGHLIPAGPLRESLDALKNCQIILINGNKDLEFEQKLKRYNSKLNFFYYNYYSKNIENFKNKKLIAFAGIGNPQNFFDFLKENYLNIVQEIHYPDHYEYKEKDLEDLSKLENKYNAKLITTEKDYLRISPFLRKKFDYVKLELKFQDEEGFKNNLKKLIV